MTQVGYLNAVDAGNLARMTGHIQTLDMSIAVRLEGDETLCDNRSPSHRIFTRTRTGADLQVGSAWLKTVKRGTHSGERFLTLTIDFPGLSTPLNVAAFHEPSTGKWTITWRRRGVASPLGVPA